MKIEALSNEALQDLFIEITDELKNRNVTLATVAQKLFLRLRKSEQSLTPQKMNKRVYAYRSKKPPYTYPDADVIRALFEIFPEHLDGFVSEVEKPPVEQRMKTLEEEVQEMKKDWYQERNYLIAELERLKRERDRDK